MHNYYEAPNWDTQNHTEPTLFLAGGITGCPDWQTPTAMRLLSHMVVYNPRRANFDVKDGGAPTQVRWEFEHLRKATEILFWFCADQIQPIALFELGCWSASDKHLWVGVDDNYPRIEDIWLQIGLVRPKQMIYHDLELMVDDIILSKAEVPSNGQMSFQII